MELCMGCQAKKISKLSWPSVKKDDVGEGQRDTYE